MYKILVTDVFGDRDWFLEKEYTDRWIAVRTASILSQKSKFIYQAVKIY